MPKKFEEMTDAEKLSAYNAMMEKRQGRKGLSVAKRTATKQLIKAHQVEYDKLLKAAGGKVTTPKA